MEKIMINISKDKLILMDGLLKDLIGIYTRLNGKESMIARYKAQRKLISIMLTDDNINAYIDSLKKRVEQETIFTSK